MSDVKLFAKFRLFTSKDTLVSVRNIKILTDVHILSPSKPVYVQWITSCDQYIRQLSETRSVFSYFVSALKCDVPKLRPVIFPFQIVLMKKIHCNNFLPLNYQRIIDSCSFKSFDK